MNPLPDKPYRRGFLLGKFMPVHRGHMHLIETAASMTEELTVLMCSVEAEPLPGALRYAWLKQLFPALRIVHVMDENPQTPDRHKFFWEIWLDTIRRHAPDSQVVFSSEDYGFELGRRLGIEHVLVDRERLRFPVSGTAVRNNPWACWEFLPPPVRAWYVRKVGLTGPESVGKSTLAARLAAHFQTEYVAEYGRAYTDRHGTANLSLLDLSHIAAGQLLHQEQAAQKADKLLFCDTDLLVTQIWSEIYCGYAPAWLVEQSHRHRCDFYLLLDIDVDWEDDGTREFPHLRRWHYERLLQELESRNYPYARISGRGEERFWNAVRAVDAHRQALGV